MRGNSALRHLTNISGTAEEYAHLTSLATTRGIMTRDRYDAMRVMSCPDQGVDICQRHASSFGRVGIRRGSRCRFEGQPSRGVLCNNFGRHCRRAVYGRPGREGLLAASRRRRGTDGGVARGEIRRSVSRPDNHQAGSFC
jgi:hypothetical protein